ncbi:MAG TPA: lipopolysaccharide biosynthesis protein [Polyangiaceae bacterium]|jgi:PST family polysaccharide transporter|nr:lipopolysaccharide biosynthesis protein [Polyangiaceae bacterium]
MKRGSLLAISGQGAKLCLQLGTTAVLARVLSPADFGLASLIGPIVSFFAVFRDVGLTSATIYSDDITDAEVSSLFWINVGAGVVLAAVVLALSPLAALFYADPRLVPILAVMALTFVLNGAAAQYQALFQRHFEFRRLTVIDITANTAGAAVAITAGLLGLGYWSLVLLPVVTQATSVVCTVTLSKWQPSRPRWERRTGMMTRFGSSIAGFNILNYFARNLDNLLIGKVWGMEALGFYGRAYQLMMAPLSQIIYPLNQVVVPVLTRVKDDPEVYRRTYKTTMRMILLVCAPLVTLLLVGRVWVIDILLGPRWQQATPIFLALGFAALVQPMNNSTGWLMLSQGRSREVFYWGVIGSAITVVSILVGLHWGALAVAVSYSLVQIVLITPLLWWFCCRRGPVSVSDLVSIATPILIPCVIAGTLFESFRVFALPRLGIELPAIVGLLLALAWIVTSGFTLLSLFPAGRDVLNGAASALRALRPAPKPGAISSPRAS